MNIFRNINRQPEMINFTNFRLSRIANARSTQKNRMTAEGATGGAAGERERERDSEEQQSIKPERRSSYICTTTIKN